jgi:TPR repeat protein
VIGGLMVAAQILGIPGALAGPGKTAWRPITAIMCRLRLFRPLAEKGNPKAQSVLGVMYRRGQGVARNSARAFVWFSRAAARGDANAKAELRDVSQAMTPEQLSQAREMAQACEASNYRSCEY